MTLSSKLSWAGGFGTSNCDSVDDVFLCYPEPVTAFHEIDSFRYQTWDYGGGCLFQKSRVLSCVTSQRTFKLISREKVNKHNANLPGSRMRGHESVLSIQHRFISINHLMSDYSLIWLRHKPSPGAGPCGSAGIWVLMEFVKCVLIDYQKTRNLASHLDTRIWTHEICEITAAAWTPSRGFM